MPDPLESLSDGELSEVFAVEVMRAWRESPTSKTIWYRGKPVKLKFATSADAVMPWLEKCLGWNVSKPFSESYHFVSVKTGDEDIFSWHNSTGETFARAACIALIRSARATQQDCGVRE